jgi:MFS family permease
MNFLKPGKPIDLSEHMLSTYQTLRRVLFIIALSFPWVLWIGGYISSHRLGLQNSMSDYYHANAVSTREKANREQPGYESIPLDSGRGVMRNWFVGVLFVVSALLIVYKGYRPAEDRALNLAGIFAVLVALVPNTWVDDREPPVDFHKVFAICFFLCIAYVAFFCASATLSRSLLTEDRRKHYRRRYKVLGVTMAASPVIAAILTQVLGLANSYIFIAEFCGIYAFAAYWFVKTREIRETDADRKATSGELQLPAGTGPSDAISEVRVTSAEEPDVEARTLQPGT